MLDAVEALIHTLQRPLIILAVTIAVFLMVLSSLHPGVDYVAMMVSLAVVMGLFHRYLGGIPRTLGIYAICMMLSGLAALGVLWKYYYA